MNESVFDVAIVGGGVVGCAVLQELTSQGYKCVLCEQNEEILSGASCGNSGTLHTGFDAPFDSMELECIKTARNLTEDFFVKNKVPFRNCGALVVAWTQEDLQKLAGIVEHSQAVGLSDITQITRSELMQMEPNLNPDALGAVYVPKETIVDPWTFPVSLACLGISQGGSVLTGCKVEGGTKDQKGWHLLTNKGPVHAKLVINCGGLFGDKVEEIIRPSPFDIKPRKGQYAVFDQSAKGLLNSIIFPVPTERTKGVLLFPSVYGNVVIGPTAEDQDDRQHASIDDAIINKLIKRAHYMIPSLQEHEVVGRYAGLRPATQFKDYQIEFLQGQDWLTIGGIRSTGLSACLGIAKHTSNLLQSKSFELFSEVPSKENDSKEWDNDNKTLVYKAHKLKFKVTHPLTLFGIETPEGLEKFKSFLG